MTRTGRNGGPSKTTAGDTGYEHFTFWEGACIDLSVDDDEQAGPGSAEVARWTRADLPPDLKYLPAKIEQHERDQLQREYDAGRYQDDLGAYTVQDQVGLPDRSPAYGEAWQATVARLDAAEALERAEIAERIAADWSRTTALSIDPNGPAELDSRDRLPARVDALHAGVRYVPPPREQPYQANADYPSTALANTRVVARPGGPGTVESKRFQTELAIAQQVAAQQVRAQQQADQETTARSVSAALGQHIAPPRSAPARSVHR
jgi:hypothetical protein